MEVIKKRSQIFNKLSGKKNIGFVPTMGALHKGHVSLFKNAKKQSKITVVSIFINPKQFSKKQDYNKYPRRQMKDLSLLKKLKIDYVFLPHFKEIYDFKTNNKIYLDKFSSKLCGKFRPGHFKGVVDVVNRLIEIIKPHKIFLGEKDFQQLVLIKQHLKSIKSKTKVISCNTIRDKSNLSFSSRNFYLSKKDLDKARNITNLIIKFKKRLKINRAKFSDIETLKKEIKKKGVKKVDYLEILNLNTLKTPKTTIEKFNIFSAYYINNVRLIDNV